MKKNLSKITVLIVAALMLCVLAGCEYLGGTTNSLPKLATPNVTISDEGIVSWDKVDNAVYYLYVIDNGEERLTLECSIKIAANKSVKVKAVSGSAEYSDSDFSKTKTYLKGGHIHTDTNSDNVCDGCGESVKAELSFYAVNDLHGKFMDTDNQPGVDELTAFFKNLYADTAREEVLLSSGDIWQGTAESSSNKGQLMTDWMNALGFASMTLGNHEYDWGAEAIMTNSEKADFPLLAINVTYNGKPVDYCQASTTVERGGIKIGIIGAIGDCLSSISGDFSPGLNFATGNALTSLVKAESNKLRDEEGCDFIVYSIHDGGTGFSTSGINSVTNSDISYYDTSLSNGYVDLVFEGHTHQHYILKDEYGVYHLQGGGENSYISCADVSYNTVTKKYTVTPKLIYKNTYASSSIIGDSVVQEIYDSYFPDNYPYTVLGTNSTNRNDTAICEAVARLYYEKGVEEWSQYNIVLGGGFLKPRSPYNVYAGNVTYADLFSVMPFDNDLVLGRISGRYLKNFFTYNNYYVYGTITLSEISNSSTYYIVVDSYTSTYAPNRIMEVARIKGTYARDLLAEFVSKGGWGSPAKSTAYCGNLSLAYAELKGYAL